MSSQRSETPKTSRPLDNVNIVSQEILPTARELGECLPVSDTVGETVLANREAVRRILSREDHRALIVVGPCSIHDLEAAEDYAKKLKVLADEVSDTFLVLMRVYFEKPRTSIGWKGFINDPWMDDSFRIAEGLERARAFLIRLGEIGIGAGTEALDPLTPQYVGDLVSWVAIGARTTESQTHRDMASGLSAPVGFKNGTDGNVAVAVNALKAVTRPQHFLGVTAEGRCAVFHTRGNRHGHIILRGGARPNYDSVSVNMCEKALRDGGVDTNIVIDCSHGNSLKDPDVQPLVLDNCISQIRDGNRSIIGFMLESNLCGGRQDIPADPKELKRGVSVTDACMGWETTERIIRQARARLGEALAGRHSP